MLDPVNRIRNVTGNYRFVSYLIRYWEILAKFGLGNDKLEKRMISRALHHYSNTRPWSSVDLGCGGRPLNMFHADEVSGSDLIANPNTNVKACNLSIDPIPLEPTALILSSLRILSSMYHASFPPLQELVFPLWT